MARRYQIDELLFLRSSPLVAKPPSLPSVEEWMGPLPDPTTQRKPSNTPRDPNNPNETTSNRRPSLFETRHISRGSNSEDIILGPPKTAFASASRIAGKGPLDVVDRSSRPNDSDDLKNDRFNFRDRFFKDRDAGDEDFDRRGAFNNRRIDKFDKEDWNNGRPRRTFGSDEQDRRPRRNGEFNRWENRDQQDRNPRDFSNLDRGPKDKDGRFTLRKDGQPGRARHEGSWFRDDNAQDGADAEEEKPSIRNREWRRDRNFVDRDWNRGAKFEQDPEWMDSNDLEPRRVHTQEDFERWKERMKAGSSQPHAEEKKEPPVEPSTSSSQKETRPTDGEIFSSTGTPFQGDVTMERFFGLLNNEPKQPQEVSTPTSADSAPKKDFFPGKPGKSSRFAGLFSPPPESPVRESNSPMGFKSPLQAAPPSGDADQEGFQRILQMLGGSKSRNATPHNDGPRPHHQPSLAQAEQARSTLSSPYREPFSRPEFMGMRNSPPVQGRGPALQENFAAHESMKDPQAREREHLLRLMQQVKVSSATGGAPQPPTAGPTGPPPGLMNMPDMLPHPPPGLQTQKTPNFLDDPAIANMQRPDSDQLRRRPAANGPPMGYFDDVPFPQGNQFPITPGGTRLPQGQGPPPMGMQRPPGFEHLPPPGWAGHQLPPQQGGGPSPMAPPPGIPAPSRGINPNFMANAMPMHGNAPLNERQPFPRGPPPGMMPPPGYMNGPPPSGFPPMPPNAEVLMGLGHAAQNPFNPGPQGPPPSSRHLLDMFGQANPGDIRGGMVGPGQFR